MISTQNINIIAYFYELLFTTTVIFFVIFNEVIFFVLPSGVDNIFQFQTLYSSEHLCPTRGPVEGFVRPQLKFFITV